ncbi:hypothetical protein Dimus_031749, partial [Dionaea muscipula]
GMPRGISQEWPMCFLARYIGPQASASSQHPKRLPGNYSNSCPAEKFRLPNYYVVSPAPVINNLPEPEYKAFNRGQQVRNLETHNAALKEDLEWCRSIADKPMGDATQAQGEASTVNHELEMMSLDRDKLQRDLE